MRGHKGTAGGAAKLLNTPSVSEEEGEIEKSAAIREPSPEMVKESPEDKYMTMKGTEALKKILRAKQVAARGAANFFADNHDGKGE